MKKLRQTLALILSITLLASIPIEAVSAVDNGEPGQQSTDNTLFDSPLGEKESEVSIIKEIEEERTEFSKEFLLSDGTKMVSVYDRPVHFLNDNDKWTDYDNTLIADGSGKLTNKSGLINVSFSKSSSESSMVQLSSDGYSFSWGYEGADVSHLTTPVAEDTRSGNEKYTKLNSATSEAVYSNAFKDADLQYVITSTGVKENLILKNSDAQNEYTVIFRSEGLSAKQTDGETLSFVNKDGEEIYSVNAPYMIDAAGQVSTQLALTLVSQDDGIVTAKLTVDSEFLKDSGRKYPVTVDPEISKTFHGLFYLDEGEGSIKLNHGPYYLSNNHSVITKANSLPVLEEGEQIISAKFTYDVTNGDTVFTSESDDPVIVNAHQITSFNGNVVNTGAAVLDYDSLTYNDNEHLTFDLTKLVKDWYAGNEDTVGFMFEANDTIGARQLNIKDKNSVDVNPSFNIIYKDFKGTENGLSYHTFEAGQGATASVSDYLGNLVVSQTVYEGTGSRMPASVSATYNSIGNAWSFSFNQKITEASAQMAALGYDYIYTDSQGTTHYLKKDDTENKWYDEDGLGISLTVGENALTVDNGNTQTYALPSAGGMLLSEKDEHNNTITYNYNNNGVITSVTDGAERTASISTSNGAVTSIQRPDNNSVTFSYSDGLLTKVVFPDGRMSRYSYNNGKLVLIEQADNISGSETVNAKLGFTYTGDKVTRITQYGSDGTQGNYLDIEYGTDNTTLFTDKQGREVTYTFDNSGNRISVLNANGYIENSAAEGLFVTGSADSFTKNYITDCVAPNLSSFSQINGSHENTQSSGGSITSDTETKYFGAYSIKITNPPSEQNTAFFTSAARNIALDVSQGETYTFSAYVKTSDVQLIYSGGAVGAALSIACCGSSDNVISKCSSIGITGTEDWQRLSISVDVPSGTDHLKIYCDLRNASGMAWFDGFQLEEGACANDLNILQNADFSASGSWYTEEDNAADIQNGSVSIGGVAGIYDDAEAEEAEETTVEETTAETTEVTEYVTSPNDTVITYDSYGNQIQSDRGFVTRLVKKTYELGGEEATEATETTEATEEPTEGDSSQSSDSLGNKYIYQTVNVGRAGVMFNIVGEAKADSVPLTNETRTFGIALNIYYDGETEPETQYQEFNSCTDKRQTVSLSVTPYDTDKVIESVAFAFVYGYNRNTMTVYNAMLNIASTGYSVVEEESTEATEPATGEPTEPATQEATEETTEEPYDDYVDYEVISESVDTSQPYMSSSASYDTNGNYAISKTDEAGNVTEYEYDANGNIIELIDGEENSTEYEYNLSGKVTKIQEDSAQNIYTYNGFNQISAIQHNGFGYSFNYDKYNRVLSTYVGNQQIETISYSRLQNNCDVITVSYANDDYIRYTYDYYGNLKRVVDESNNIVSFYYNKKGLISKIFESSKQRSFTTYYYFDFCGNLIGRYCQTMYGEVMYHIGFDSEGCKIETTSVNGSIKRIKNIENDEGSFLEDDKFKIHSAKDGFGRTTCISTTNKNSNNVFSTIFEYQNGNQPNKTTNLVKKMTHMRNNSELVNYEYTYDGNGNIVDIKQNGQIVAIYTYDSKNQLSWSADSITGLYTQFTYDNGGNITRVREYTLSTYNWTPVTLLSDRQYVYNDSNWKDKLTSFNNQTITYDEIGNPINYRDGMSFTWERGRRLSTVSTGDGFISMVYNKDCLRSRKVNGSVSTEYYYDSNGTLTGLTKGDDTLLFYYDKNGIPTSFSKNGTMYFYVKNLQGDIVKIVNESGTPVVNYSYDVLGKILSITNSQGHTISESSHIAFLNPYRYRGYVYDDETGLYYLQSRYYDPVTGRFINSDSIQIASNTNNVLMSNMYTYCANNPVRHVDPNGELFFDLIFPLLPTVQPIIDFSKTTILSLSSLITVPILNYAYNNSMTMQFYLRAITNLEYKKMYGFINNKMYAEKIRNSNAFKSFLGQTDDILEGLYHQMFGDWAYWAKDGKISFYSNEPDLYLSLGECSIAVTITFFSKMNKPNTFKWLVKVALLDEYNFENWNQTKKDWFTIFVNNNFGFKLQESGILTPYCWLIYFEYYLVYTLRWPTP